MVNSSDPDQMPHVVTSDLSVHCLLISAEFTYRMLSCKESQVFFDIFIKVWNSFSFIQEQK